jgi:hypothetical protein
LCKGTHGLPTTLRALGYIPEAVETTFSNSEDRLVAPELIIASAQIHHTVAFEWKSGANTEADQLQRYSRIVPQDLVAKAYIHVSKCATHDVAVIGTDEHRATIPIGVVNGGYVFPVLVTTTQGIEIIHNAFGNEPTDVAFRPLLRVNWSTLPTHFFPLDSDSELWEFAEQAIPFVLEAMANGAPNITQNDLGQKMFRQMWDRMRADYRGLLKQKIQQVMDQASRGQFSKHLERIVGGRSGNQPSWGVLDNPLIGAADKRQKAWKVMLKKQQALIDYFKDEHRQEYLEIDGGQPIP